MSSKLDLYKLVVFLFIVVCIIVLPALLRPSREQTENEKKQDNIVKWVLAGVGALIAFPFMFYLFFQYALRYGGDHVDYDEEIDKAYKIKRADTRVNPVFAGEIEPPIPDEDENEETLAGIDTNKNGVRDDIDIYINRMAINDNEILALRLLAQSYQEQILMPEDRDMEIYHKSRDKGKRAKNCVEFVALALRENGTNNYREWPDMVIPELITDSTDNRKNAYEAVNKEFSYQGKGIGGNNIDAWKDCDFKINDFQEIVERNKKLGAKK